MTDDPEKAVNLLWAVDEIIIALQKLRQRLLKMAQQEAIPKAPVLIAATDWFLLPVLP